MHINEIDGLVIGKGREAHGRAVHRGDQGELIGQPPGELLIIIDRRGPSLLLRLVVILRGQFLDAGAEDLREQRRVLDEEGAQRELRVRTRHHRAVSQVVLSLESFSITPSAASSSRMRSASAKFLALRAERRAAMRRSISSAGSAGAGARDARHCANASGRKPKNASVPASALRPVALRSACISAIALGVLRSSASASTTPGAGRASASADAASKNLASDFPASSSPFRVQLIGLL